MKTHRGSTVSVSPSGRITASDADLARRLRKVLDGGPAAIEDRLARLNWEWSAGRAAKATAGVLVVAGLAVALATQNLWWLVLPIAGGAIFVPYVFGRESLAGDLFRAFGLRSGAEIDEEKVALKVLRGDFQHLPTVHHVEDRESIARLEDEGGIVYEADHAKVDADQAVFAVIGAARR